VPTYDYQCRSCGAVTEVIHAMSEDGPAVCERCGGELRRVLYPAGIIFKGSGFYRTDSRSNGDATPANKAASADAPAGVGSSEGGKSGEGSASPEGGKARSGSSSETKTTGGSPSATSTDTSG
jgi:putative FmdB family regulatory protein